MLNIIYKRQQDHFSYAEKRNRTLLDMIVDDGCQTISDSKGNNTKKIPVSICAIK